MTLQQIRAVLRQTKDLGTVDTVYFEGGEPFLFYAILLQGLREAAALGFKRGIVTNAYWATSVEDAVQWLQPIADIGLDDLSLSSDLFHGEAMLTQAARHAMEAAEQLGLPQGIISVEAPAGCTAYAGQASARDGDPQGQGPSERGEPIPRNTGDPITGGPVRFRGRAVARLAPDPSKYSGPRGNGSPGAGQSEGWTARRWTEFNECPDEDFANPGRVHVDTYGHVHICQGLLMGNLWNQPLTEIVASYDPNSHPIIGPLADGGPAALVERYDLPHAETYLDACHLCYLARDALRSWFPEFLAPPQVYGEL
jgi:hypothetical protein